MNMMADTTPLMTLVDRSQKGDGDAFEQLVARTQNMAKRIAYSLVPSSQVDDVLQESYLLVFRKLPQLQKTEAFLGWFSRLVLGVSYDLLRKIKTPPEKQEPEASRDHAEAVVSQLVLRRALDMLQRKDRDILILRELLDLNYEEIAVALRLPLGTVRSRLHSARKELAKRLELIG